MFPCPHSQRKLKTKSSLNRHIREACKKNRAKRRPAAEIRVAASPGGNSDVSALRNPEYLPPEFQVVAAGTTNVESVTLDLDMFTDLSPMMSPLKRTGAYDSADRKKAARSSQTTEAEPTFLNFEEDSSNSDSDNGDNYKDTSMECEVDSDDDLSDDCSVPYVPGNDVGDADSASAESSFAMLDDMSSESGKEMIRTWCQC
jgi:hypothetical protein